MKIYNNTQFPLDQINSLPLIGFTVNKWRNRNIRLLQHPTDKDRIISHAQTIVGHQTPMQVICDDLLSDWEVALDYIAHGKVYISE